MEDTILALEKQAMERWRSGDPGGFADLSANEITYIDPGLSCPIVGRQAFTTFMRQLEGKVHYQRSEFIGPRVVVAGESAVLSYNYRSSVLTPEGAVVSQTPWNATEVYFRQAGEWKIAHTHWSYLPHQLPARVELPVPVEMAPREYEGVLGEVMKLESAAMERWRKGDPWGFIEISAPDVTYFDSGTPQRINGREALSAEYALRAGKIFYDAMDFVDPRAQVCGELAVLSYRFLSTWLNPAGAVTHRTPWNCTEVFRRLDGQWKIIHTHWSLLRGERP